MRRTTRLAGLLLAVGGLLLGGCATVDEGYWVSSYPGYTRYVAVNEYRYVNPHGLLVVYDPGVMRYSVVRYPGLYWHDGHYYRHHGDRWQRSAWYGGPWVGHGHEPPRIKLEARAPDARYVGQAAEPRRWDGARTPDRDRQPPRGRFEGFSPEHRPARIADRPLPERRERMPDAEGWRGERAKAVEPQGRGPAADGSPDWARRWDRAPAPSLDPAPEPPGRLKVDRPDRLPPAGRQDPRQGPERELSAERDPGGQGGERSPASRAQPPTEPGPGRAFAQRPADRASAAGRRWSAEGEQGSSPGADPRAEGPASTPRAERWRQASRLTTGAPVP
ncbi:MAG: hypothetical protein MUC77_05610 [Chromatiaceae bacterium]|jgi:hypothetical protein|nr:hypothetical protein [Chromatiaceae bacterium]